MSDDIELRVESDFLTTESLARHDDYFVSAHKYSMYNCAFIHQTYACK